MKSSFAILTVSALAVVLMMDSCTYSEGIDKIVAERDSLWAEAQNQRGLITGYETLLATVNNGMDSIARSEQGVFINDNSEHAATKDEVLQNLDRLQNIIASNKRRIGSLERELAQLDNSSSNSGEMERMIANYKRQLLEKERQIALLKEELSQKAADISALQAKVGNQLRVIADLDRRNAMQDEALKRQDAALNQCYMAIGSKQKLQSKGIVRKGKLVTKSAFDRAKFAKVDIRRATEFEFPAKRPRILTPMPENAYVLTTDGHGSYKLTITDATAFWSTSNFLVIQTD